MQFLVQDISLFESFAAQATESEVSEKLIKNLEECVGSVCIWKEEMS